MDVNWIKITTNMFEDEKIDYIESMPEADTILMIWVRLLTMAGKSNVGGYIMLTEKIPYTDEMLAHKFKRQLNTVKFALQTFAKLDMVVLDDSGFKIANWDKHQNVQGLDKIREQNKVRKQKQRLTDKKQLAAGQDKPVTPCHVTITHESRTLSIIDKELELDKEISTIIVPTFVETDIPTDQEEVPEELQPKEKYKYSQEHMDLAKRLNDLMLDNKPNMKVPSSLGKWANTIRLMIDRDTRGPEQIAAVIDWCQQDKFWKLNILSADTLREKFDRLEMQMQEKCRGVTAQAGNLGKLSGVVAGARDFIAEHGGVNNGISRDDCHDDNIGSRQLQHNPDKGRSESPDRFVVPNIFTSS